jgi:hypothetical protein
VFGIVHVDQQGLDEVVIGLVLLVFLQVGNHCPAVEKVSENR